MNNKQKLKLFDIIALSFASFFSIELVASQASIGPSMIFCMILFGGVYLLCHGSICAELGSTYPDQGGIYVWTLNAFGSRWAARNTWWYWVNVLAFIPCTLVALFIIIQQILWPDMSVATMTILCVIGTWVIILLNFLPLEDSKLLSNVGSVLKVVVCVLAVIGAVAYAAKNGSANEFSAAAIFPKFDLQLLALIPVYIYGLTGMDLISCNSERMANPKKDVPKAIAVSGIISILVYIASAVAVLLVMPRDDIDEASGLIDALITIFNGSRVVIYGLGAALIVVYASYLFGWTIGGNTAALEAGEAGELPAVFAKTNKYHAPVGAAVLMGICSTVLLLVYGFTANSSSGLFWTLLAFTSIIFFLPYVVMSFIFLKMRKADTDAERPFKIPGKALPHVVAIAHLLLLIVSIIGYLPPLEGEEPLSYILSLIVGLVVTQIVGEILIKVAANKQEKQE